MSTPRTLHYVRTSRSASYHLLPPGADAAYCGTRPLARDGNQWLEDLASPRSVAQQCHRCLAGQSKAKHAALDADLAARAAARDAPQTPAPHATSSPRRRRSKTQA